MPCGFLLLLALSRSSSSSSFNNPASGVAPGGGLEGATAPIRGGKAIFSEIFGIYSILYNRLNTSRAVPGKFLGVLSLHVPTKWVWPMT